MSLSGLPASSRATRSRARARLRLRRRAARFRSCCIRRRRKGAPCYASAARWAGTTGRRCSIRGSVSRCRATLTIARLDYREPGEFGECLVDAMAALTFLGGIGNERVALIGHSFGGAVAINAGTISPLVTTVIALSSQLAGAHVVGELAPKPILLIHGDADTILSHESSQALYDRAAEPKTIKILPGVGHRLAEASEEVFGSQRLADGTTTLIPSPAPVPSSIVGGGLGRRTAAARLSGARQIFCRREETSELRSHPPLADERRPPPTQGGGDSIRFQKTNASLQISVTFNLLTILPVCTVCDLPQRRGRRGNTSLQCPHHDRIARWLMDNELR